jgi:DNA-binding SARP family transcriptional activator
MNAPPATGAAVPVLDVDVCGPLRLRHNGQPVESEALSRWHVKALLALLAGADGHAIERDALCEALWPDSTATAARNRLYHTVLLLKRALVSLAGAREWVCVSDGRVMLHPDVASDAAAVRLLAGQPDTGCSEAWLLRHEGPLEPFAPWLADSALVRSCRAEIAAAWLAVARQVAGEAANHEDTPARRRLLEQLLEVAPADESTHRALMELDLRAGRPHLVLRRYATCARAMAEQLGLKPAAATALLAQRASSYLAAADSPDAGNGPGPSHVALPLLGREQLLQQVTALLRDPSSRVLTLCGLGGVGKSRLARELCCRLTGAELGVVRWIDCRAAPDSGDVVTRLAAEVGDAMQAPTPRASRDLWVLDNADRVDGLAPALVGLLIQAPAARVLLTRVMPLGLAEERVCMVPPLALPDPAAEPAEWAANPAVRLFPGRAPADLPITTVRLQEFAQLARALDGLPLALELAAARLPFYTAGELTSQLLHDLRALDEGPLDFAGHQRSISATFDFTTEALSAAARIVYGVASVPAGTFDAALLAALLPNDTVVNIDSAIAELARAGLLHPVAPSDQGTARWRMGQLARRHAAARAGGSAADRHARDRHVEWLFATAKPKLDALAGPDAAAAARHLDGLQADIDASLKQLLLIRPHDLPARVLSLAPYWQVRASYGHGMRWCETALSIATRVGSAGLSGTTARLQAHLARLHLVQMNIEAGAACACAAMETAKRCDDPVARRAAAIAHVEALIGGGELDTAVAQASSWLEGPTDRLSADDWRLRALGWMAREATGDAAACERPEINDDSAPAHLPPDARLDLDSVKWLDLRRRGDWAGALALAQGAVARVEALGASHLLVRALVQLAQSCCALNDATGAWEAVQRAIESAGQLRLPGAAAAAATFGVEALLQQGRVDAAGELLDVHAGTLLDPCRGTAVRAMYRLRAAQIAAARGAWRDVATQLIALTGDAGILRSGPVAIGAAELGVLACAAAGEPHRALGLLEVLEVAGRDAPTRSTPSAQRWLQAQRQRLSERAAAGAPVVSMAPGQALTAIREQLQDLAVALALRRGSTTSDNGAENGASSLAAPALS